MNPTTLLALPLMASLALSGCGGKSELETDPLLLPANIGGTGSTVVVSYGGSRGGTTSTVTTRPSGGFSMGGSIAIGGLGGYVTATGGRTLATGCPDELTYQPPPLVVYRNLSNFTDRYQPSCRAAVGSPDFTYAWYASEAGTYVVDTLGSSTDTVLAAYAGLCGNVEIACNDDDAYGTSRQSRIVLDIVEPQFVTLVVDSYLASAGAFQLKINRDSSLVNGLLPSVVPLSIPASSSGLLDYSTSTCNGKISSSDYTFLYRAPTSGTFQFLVESSSFDPVLTLRENSPAGREITCNDDFSGSNPSVSYALYAGQVVALVVDGFEGSSGDFLLTVTRSTSDLGSCCSPSTLRAGCVDPGISRCVCAAQSACCRTAWDTNCTAAVSTLGCGSCGI